jgi:hypothetical protein
MPKLKVSTAILRIVDKHTYKEGALFRDIREQCIKWGISPENIESTIQRLLDLGKIEEPVIGYIRRKKLNNE